MEIVNKIKDGLHLDNNVYDQPEMTMRDNLNGVITDVGSGNYKWSDIKGNELSFTIGSSYEYMAHCKIKDRLIIIALAGNTLNVRFIEIVFTGTTGAPTVLHTISNTVLNLQHAYPIRVCWGFYESEDIQRVYWSDYNTSPRCINIEVTPTTAVKFLDYFPVIDKVYGHMTTTTTSAGGTVKAGTVFFAWRFYTTDGYYTDWSYLAGPVAVTDGTPGTSLDNYQAFEGMAPDDNTAKKITITLEDLDSDYDNIQICAFYSNDYNISNPGEIFYDGALGATTKTVDYTGTGNFGTVTIDELIETSIKIDKFKESTVAKKQNVIACMNERAEIDLDYFVAADIAVTTRYIPLDVAGYPPKMAAAGSPKALFGLYGTPLDEANHTLRRGQWYYADQEVVWNNGSGPVTTTIDTIFYTPEDAGAAFTWTSGNFSAIVVKKKYLLAGGTPGGNINTEYAFEYERLNDEHYDWKSQKVCKYYKSYPMGEKVRLGVLFFDLTGRPWFVRHLKNNNASGFGTGDTDIPVRDETNPMLELSGWTVVGADGYYQNACAALKVLQVNGLDISAIKDEISGFMIVRAPIIRQYHGMGLILPTYLVTNDVFSYPHFFPHTLYSNNYFTCYSFYCPEDMLNFKGFTLQSGDDLENIVYLRPYVFDEQYAFAGGTFQGFGRQESINYDFYQKLMREFDPAVHCAHGVLGLSHEIVSVTKYTLGDADLPINPADSTKLYQYFCAGYSDGSGGGGDIHAGINGNHSVVVLDITDNNANVKGPADSDCTTSNPYALLCAVKRPNADPYGGYSESSVANSVYISTGHFQEITPAVLAAIEVTGTWIFNEIDIYGGDTFVQLFDFKRLYIEYDLATNALGQSMIFPVESKMNLSMREGEHPAKTRSYDSSFNATGLQKRTGFTVLEDFNYNDGYSTDDINDQYLPLPFNYTPASEFLTRIRYSSEKNYGENRDSFRRFAANDYIDLDPMKGAISNILSENDKLAYWQPDEVGYIPINERALTQNSVGQSVQIGVGGIFERYDRLIDKIGNSHQFGLIESPIGYHWYDSRRKIYLTITHNLQISFESILKGMDSWFQNNIPDGLEAYDNPFTSYGVFGGYDPLSKMIFTSFVIPGPTRYTIGINSVLNKFIGIFNIYPLSYLTYKNHMFPIKQDKLTGYVHGTNSTYMNFFGTQYPGYVQIVIKETTNIAKIFDNFEIIASSNFFTSVLYENSEQTKEETVSSYATGSCVVSNRDYKYLKKRWFGSFPKVSRERLNDGYLLVTFKIASPYLVELYEMKSIARKNM